MKTIKKAGPLDACEYEQLLLSRQLFTATTGERSIDVIFTVDEMKYVCAECMLSRFSCFQLFANPWTVARQAAKQAS